MTLFQPLLAQICRDPQHPLLPHLGPLATSLAHWQRQAHGDWPQWLKTLSQLPIASASQVDLADSVSVGSSDDLPAGVINNAENHADLTSWCDTRGPT